MLRRRSLSTNAASVPTAVVNRQSLVAAPLYLWSHLLPRTHRQVSPHDRHGSAVLLREHRVRLKVVLEDQRCSHTKTEGRNAGSYRSAATAHVPKQTGPPHTRCLDWTAEPCPKSSGSHPSLAVLAQVVFCFATLTTGPIATVMTRRDMDQTHKKKRVGYHLRFCSVAVLALELPPVRMG